MVSKSFYFHPDPWGRFQFWRSYFSKGLVQPPTSGWFFWDVWWVKIRLGCLGLECRTYQLFGKQKGIASWTNQTDPRIRCRVFTTCCVSALSLGKIGGCNGAPFCWKVGCFWVGNLGLKNTPVHWVLLLSLDALVALKIWCSSWFFAIYIFLLLVLWALLVVSLFLLMMLFFLHVAT